MLYLTQAQVKDSFCRCHRIATLGNAWEGLIRVNYFDPQEVLERIVDESLSVGRAY